MNRYAPNQHASWIEHAYESYAPEDEGYAPSSPRVAGAGTEIEARVGLLFQAISAVEERFHFVAFGSSGFVPVTAWAANGYPLCLELSKLRGGVKFPQTTKLHLVSSTKGWSKLLGTVEQWWGFLGCAKLEPWKSHFGGYG